MSIRAFIKASFFNLFFIIPVFLFAQQTKIYDNPEASYRLGLDLIEKKQYGAAQDVFHGLLAGLPAGESVMRLDAEFFDAMCDYKLDHPEAKQKFQQFILHYPDHSRTNKALLYLGFIDYSSRRYKNALESFNKVDPYLLSPHELSEYLYKMGYCYLQEDNYKKAKEVLFPILNTQSDFQDAANYYYAHIAYMEKDYDEALKYFRKLDKDSEFGQEVPFYLLQINYINGNFDEIAKIGPGIIVEIDDKKKKAEAARICAEAFYVNKDFGKSLSYFEKYQEYSRKPLTAEESYQLAYVCYQTGDYEKAITNFQKVAKGNDEMAQNAYYHLADCYLKTGEKKFAQNAFYSAWQIDANEKVKEDALFNYAKLTFEMAYDPFNNSIGALTQYITDYPGSDRIDEAYMYLTNIFLSTKDYQAAIDAIENIRVKNRDLKAAYQKITYQRGVQLFNAVRFDEALENFRKSLSNNYSAELTARARFWTAETHYRMGNYTKAIDYYDNFMVAPGAYELTDIYPMTKYNLGYAYFNLEYYDNAVVTFQQFVSRPVKNDKGYATDAILRMGDCYFITQNYADAVKEYSRAIQRESPESDYALFQKALSQGAMGQNAEKIATLQKLLKEHPQTSYTDDAYYEIAETYMLLNDSRNALSWYDQLIGKYPNSSYVVRSMQKSGLVYYNENNYDKALEFLKRIVRDYPGTPEALEALSSIRNIYIDKNAVGEYYSYLETVPFANISTSEQDSLTYLAAENLYMNNDCASAVRAFGAYKQQFPSGAFILNATYYKAECDYKLQNPEDALAGYSSVVQFPKSRFTENALVRAGQLNYNFENYAIALENYNQLELIADYQNNITVAINGQLNCNYELGNYRKALNAARNLLKRDKLDNGQILDAHYIMAKSALAIDSLSVASVQFEKMVQLSDDEKGAESKYMLASIQFTLNNYQKAEELIFELINDYPAFEYWKAKGFIMLADIYSANGDAFQARQTLLSIIENYPGEDLKMVASEKLQILDASEAVKEIQEYDTINKSKKR